MSQHEIEQIELSMEQAKAVVERARLARQLSKNPAFKKLIMDGYFVDEAARLAHLVSDPALAPEHRQFVFNDLNGVGALKRYLSTIVRMGDAAEREIAEAEMELEELRNEGGDE